MNANKHMRIDVIVIQVQSYNRGAGYVFFCNRGVQKVHGTKDSVHSLLWPSAQFLFYEANESAIYVIGLEPF